MFKLPYSKKQGELKKQEIAETEKEVVVSSQKRRFGECAPSAMMRASAEP